MFRWCSYCQRLTGEAEPYDRYLISHGICDVCQERLLSDPNKALEDSSRIAGKFYEFLADAGRQKDAEAAEVFVRRAAEAGLRRSDVLVGLIQPALSDAAERWRKSSFGAADKRRLTLWSKRVLGLFSVGRPPRSKKTRVLLACAEGGFAQVGARILEIHLQDLGYDCRSACDLSFDGQLEAACRERKADVLVLIVNSQAEVPAAEAFALLLKERAKSLQVVFGGQVFREKRSFAPVGLKICRGLDDFVEYLGGLEKRGR
jgi:hypothetical protein